MSLIVTPTVVVGAFLWWSRALLVDEDRYLRSVAPLSRSPAFHQVSATFVALAVRHRSPLRRAPARLGSRVAGSATRWSMRSRTFAHTWIPANRFLHRHRPARGRVVVVMVALGTMGSLVGVAQSLRGRPVGDRVVGDRVVGDRPANRR